MVFAHACRTKGSDADALEAMMADIDVLGHRQIVCKSDQETSIQALQRELAARRQEMQLENSLKHHSAANGRVENAVQRVIGLTTALKDALEANIKQAVEPNVPMTTFMVNHAVTITNRLSVDQDGRTPMERTRRTTANHDIGDFGEKILFQSMTKYNKTKKLDVWRRFGLFMAVTTRTNEIMVSGPDGNWRAWTFRRLPENQTVGCRRNYARERISVWHGV